MMMMMAIIMSVVVFMTQVYYDPYFKFTQYILYKTMTWTEYDKYNDYVNYVYTICKAKIA